MPLGDLTMSHGNPNEGRYDPTTIWLHWTTVILVVVLWVIGQTADALIGFRGGDKLCISNVL